MLASFPKVPNTYRKRNVRNPEKHVFDYLIYCCMTSHFQGTPANIRINLTLSESRVIVIGLHRRRWQCSLHSNLRGWLRKTHVFWSTVHNGPLRSSKVVDFDINQKRVLCAFIAFPLTPNHGTLNDLESPFFVKFYFAPACLELWSLAFEAWLLLNLYWMSPVNFKPKRTTVASRGFLATARLSCILLHCICPCIKMLSAISL